MFYFAFRFQLYYYSNFEFKKEERKETVLTIDTRTKALGTVIDNNLQDNDDDDDATEPALQLAIKTKYQILLRFSGLVIKMSFFLQMGRSRN